MLKKLKQYCRLVKHKFSSIESMRGKIILTLPNIYKKNEILHMDSHFYKLKIKSKLFYVNITIVEELNLIKFNS